MRRLSLPLVALVALVASSCGRLPSLSTKQALDRLNIASTKLFAADGSLIANLHGEINRDIVPIKEIPKHVQDAVVAIEDERFWSHGGIDLRGITRALVANAQRGNGENVEGVQGASTISQQLVKNLYFTELGESCLRRGLPLDRCAAPTRLSRKIAEARISFQFEKQYSKRKILEMYLNTIYLGRGIYGVQTGARSYFRKDASKLTLSEAAFLAGLVHEPAAYEFTDKDSPERRESRIKAGTGRRNVVLAKMRDLGFVTQPRYEGAAGEPLKVLPPGQDEWQYPYFVDMVLRQLGVLRNSRSTTLDSRYRFLGETFEDRSRNVYRGGLRIYTTLDPSAQAAAEEAVERVLPDQLTKLSAALASVETGTGYIRAIVGGRDYYPECDESVPSAQRSLECRLAKVNLALGDFGGGSGRQPGSSFKPFTLAGALEHGVSLRRSFDSAPFSHRFGGGTWKVGNYEGSGGGAMDLVEGTVSSVNAVFAHLMIDGVGDGDARAGSRRVASLVRKMGIPFATEQEIRASSRCRNSYGKGGCIAADEVPAIALGAKEVAPFDMAVAFATFANEGVHVEPTAIVRITDASGKTLFEANPRRQRALPRGVALGASHVLTQVIQRGTGTKARLGRSAAGKTGTSQEWRDAWFAGYVPQLATVVWVGNPIPVLRKEKRCRSAPADKVPGGCYEPESMTPGNGYPFRVVGGTFPAMIWQYYMTKALANVPAKPFPAPPSQFFVSQAGATPTPGPLAPVPDVLGRSREDATDALKSAGYTVRETKCLDPTGNWPEGTVVRQSPAGGLEYATGSAVEICLSVRELPNVIGSSPSPRFGRGAQDGTVPGVVGSSRAQARAAIRSAGLEPDDVAECDPSGSAGKQRVWRQNPPAGTRAAAGSSVTIWYQPTSCDD